LLLFVAVNVEVCSLFVKIVDNVLSIEDPFSMMVRFSIWIEGRVGQ